MMSTILLVDDEQNFLKSLADALHGYVEGWNVLTAQNGRQGIEVFESQPVNIIVTDLRMPIMDGIEFLSYVRSKNPRIPVIVMTAGGCADLEERLNSIGAAWCLRKPFKITEMVSTISRQLA